MPYAINNPGIVCRDGRCYERGILWSGMTFLVPDFDAPIKSVYEDNQEQGR